MERSELSKDWFFSSARSVSLGGGVVVVGGGGGGTVGFSCLMDIEKESSPFAIVFVNSKVIVKRSVE